MKDKRNCQDSKNNKNENTNQTNYRNIYKHVQFKVKKKVNR